MSSGNANTVKIPAMLPTAPLPLNAVVATSNVMYMYSCSQCEFKTHIESLFKQHVDSVHLGIPSVPANVILGQNTTAQVQIQAPTATTPPAIVMAATGGQQFHKCPKCNQLLPSKNQLSRHKRTVHGKAAIAAGTGGAGTGTTITVPTNAGVTTYAVVTSPPVVSASGNSVVASLVSQQPVSVLAAVAAAASSSSSSSSPSAPSAAPGGGSVVATTNITGKKTYSCTACGYSTTRRDGLSQHYDSVHLKIKNHQCELCPYAASQKGTLNRHVKLRHKKKDLVTTVVTTQSSNVQTQGSSVLS